MINKKNIYSIEKTKKFFKEYPLILVYQHNNLTVKQHIDLKIQLQSFPTIKTFTAKNSLLEKACISFLKEKNQDLTLNQLKNLIQGPVFFLGCHSLEDIKNIWNIFKTSPSFLFLGSKYNNQLYTHLDIQKSLEINNTIYCELLNILNQQLNSKLCYSTMFPLIEKTYILNSLGEN